MNEKLVSVIVPIYNVEAYLNRCIDSIVNQTYKNLEILLIDDGSTDYSGKICDEYAKKDKRITTIHKKNGGLSDARNVGIEKANGKYITFVDSDDYIDIDYIEYLYSLIKKYKTNISFCKLRVIYNNNKRNQKQNAKDCIYNKIKAFKDILYAKNFDVSACGKMYLTEDFADVRFPKGKLFEDNATIYKIIDKNEYIAVGFEYKYNYIIRKNSITKKEFNDKQIDLITASDSMCNYLKKYKKLNNAIKRKKFWARISTYNRMINSTNRNTENERRMREDILKYKSVMFDRKSSARDKVSLLLLIFGANFYKKAWNLYLKMREK